MIYNICQSNEKVHFRVYSINFILCVVDFILPGKTIVFSMHQRNSSSVSPFHAYTGTPAFAMAAAA